MEKYLEAFKAVACIMRLRILRLLMHAKKGLCVCELMDALGESQYNVSRHLKILKYAGFVKDEKKGRWIEYNLVEPKNEFYRNLYETISLIPEENFRKDFDRLEDRLLLRKDGKCIIGITNS